MEPDPMAVVATYETADDAKSQASSLVEHGLGATVEQSGDGRWTVAVLPGDRSRARELLGLPESPGDDLDDDGDELTRSVRSMLVPVLVGVGVLFLVPLIAFFVSYKLSGG
jgi:hypothetical protein